MAVKSEQIEKNLVKLTFEVSAEDFEKAVQQAYLKNKNKINVKGFRKGKAPRAVIEKEYGVGVFYDEAINAVLPEAYEAAAKESGADIVARPEIDVEDIKKGENVVFTALVTTRPEVKLGEYKGIEIEKIEHNVTDEDVQKELENAQKQNARLITVEDRAVENGDITTIDFEGFVDGVAFEGGKGTDYQLEIGSNTFIPGFISAIVRTDAFFLPEFVFAYSFFLSASLLRDASISSFLSLPCNPSVLKRKSFIICLASSSASSIIRDASAFAFSVLF